MPIRYPPAVRGIAAAWRAFVVDHNLFSVFHACSSGPNQWRDQLRPSQLLHYLSLQRHGKTPIYNPDRIIFGDQTYGLSNMGKIIASLPLYSA